MAEPSIMDFLKKYDVGGMQAGLNNSELGVSDSMQMLNNSGGMGDAGGFDFGLNKGTFGALSTGASALGDLFNIYAGIKGLNQSKDMFNFNRGLAETNLTNQANLTNERLATRQNSRLRSQGLSPEEVQAGVNEFMSKYGVKGRIGG